MNIATIAVNNIWCRLCGINNLEIVDMLDNELSYFIEGYRYMRAFTQGWFDKKSQQWKRWDGKKHLLTQRMIFPIGLLDRVKEFLDFNGVIYEIVDNRERIECNPIKISTYDPRPYQQEAVDIAYEKGRGIIRIATGGGKTLVTAMLLAKYNIPSMIYVIGKDLLYQFYEEMIKCLGEENVGIIGDGRCEIKKFNICSIWTAAKAFELRSKVSLDDEDWTPDIININGKNKQIIKSAIENSRFVIFDEAHFLACETIQSIFKAGKMCRFMFGLTGTDWRDDGADLLLESVCGKRIYNISASNLINKGYLVKPKIALIKVPKHADVTKRMKWGQVYSKYITNNDIRNALVANSAKKLISMGRKVLILIRYIKHEKNIVDMIDENSIYFVNGSIDAEERLNVKKRFERGEIKCLIASSVFDIGVDLPSLDSLILAGGGCSTVRTLQRIGRVIRKGKGKKDAIVVDFIDDARYLDKHSATRIKIYETEPEFQIKFPKGFKKENLKKINISSKIQTSNM